MVLLADGVSTEIFSSLPVFSLSSSFILLLCPSNKGRVDWIFWLLISLIGRFSTTKIYFCDKYLSTYYFFLPLLNTSLFLFLWSVVPNTLWTSTYWTFLEVCVSLATTGLKTLWNINFSIHYILDNIIIKNSFTTFR